MKITKKIVNKIEGEASLKIYGDKKVDFIEIEFWQYRGIESYLINRPIMDALVINPRICGICGHSHLFATVKAIENAVNAKISKKAKILRDITVGLEIVENHIKWFYITLFPTQIKNKKYIFKAGEFASLISKAIALIAGQYPHNSYMIPGGVN
jgi:Ni,Fe-hydrogenase I large subunit